MPDTTPKMAAQLGIAGEAMSYDDLKGFGTHAAYTVQKGEALFPPH